MTFGSAVAAALAAGWWTREEGHIVPDTGTGYLLGIAGAVLMLLLLAYPLRKRFKSLAALGRVSLWFRIHMMLGIVGPALILFHSNFKLGSLNSNVALFTMLLVAGSGLAGRYLYAKIHQGLTGRRAEVREILADMAALKRLAGADAGAEQELTAGIAAFEERILRPRRSVSGSLAAAMAAGAEARRTQRRLTACLKGAIREEAARRGWGWRERRNRLAAARRYLALYFSAARKAAQFAFYERLFALWHIFHLPLFVLFVFAAIVHVVAVHLY